MNKSELMKTANEIRKSIVTAVTLPNPDIRADLCQQQTSTHIYILKS